MRIQTTRTTKDENAVQTTGTTKHENTDNKNNKTRGYKQQEQHNTRMQTTRTTKHENIDNKNKQTNKQTRQYRQQQQQNENANNNNKQTNKHDNTDNNNNNNTRTQTTIYHIFGPRGTPGSSKNWSGRGWWEHVGKEWGPSVPFYTKNLKMELPWRCRGTSGDHFGSPGHPGAPPETHFGTPGHPRELEKVVSGRVLGAPRKRRWTLDPY